MNKRIEELIKQSYFYDEPNDSTIFDREKFAELLVLECGVALNPPVQVRNVISRGQAYDLIKQHFGVKE